MKHYRWFIAVLTLCVGGFVKLIEKGRAHPVGVNARYLYASCGSPPTSPHVATACSRITRQACSNPRLSPPGRDKSPISDSAEESSPVYGTARKGSPHGGDSLRDCKA